MDEPDPTTRSPRPSPTPATADTPSGQPPLGVMVVDDESGARALVRTALSLEEGFELVGTAVNGASALDLAARLHPEAIVLDLGLPDARGLGVLAELSRVSPQSRIVVYSVDDASATVDAALKGAASTYVVKGGDISLLIRALGEPTATVHEAVTSFDAAPESTSAARRFVRDLCCNWDYADASDSAELITSELLTNAVVHVGARCTLAVGVRRDVIRIEVIDHSPHMASPPTGTEDSEHGRGLFIVAALSTAWGIDPMPQGKAVWAELAHSGNGRGDGAHH